MVRLISIKLVFFGIDEPAFFIESFQIMKSAEKLLVSLTKLWLAHFRDNSGAENNVKGNTAKSADLQFGDLFGSETTQIGSDLLSVIMGKVLFEEVSLGQIAIDLFRLFGPLRHYQCFHRKW